MEHAGWTLTIRRYTYGIPLGVLATRGEKSILLASSAWQTEEQALEGMKGTIDRHLVERVSGAAPVLVPGGEGAGD